MEDLDLNMEADGYPHMRTYQDILRPEQMEPVIMDIGRGQQANASRRFSKSVRGGRGYSRDAPANGAALFCAPRTGGGRIRGGRGGGRAGRYPVHRRDNYH